METVILLLKLQIYIKCVTFSKLHDILIYNSCIVHDIEIYIFVWNVSCTVLFILAAFKIEATVFDGKQYNSKSTATALISAYRGQLSLSMLLKPGIWMYSGQFWSATSLCQCNTCQANHYVSALSLVAFQQLLT